VGDRLTAGQVIPRLEPQNEMNALRAANWRRNGTVEESAKSQASVIAVVPVIIAVLAVLFLREAVERAKDLDLLRLAATLAIMIAALALFLSLRENRKDDPSGGGQA